MEWLRVFVGGDLSGSIPVWLPLVLFWLLLFLLAGAELAWPLHGRQQESGGRLVANFGLGIINALLLSALPVSTVIAAQWSRAEGFGLLHRLAVPEGAAIVVTLLVWSLAIYASHVLAHRVPLLWRMHQVHHSDIALDLSTGVRHHPLEPLYLAPLFSGIAALLGLSAAAIAAYSVAAAAFALWSHANLRLPEPLDRLLRSVLMTPAAHHVHHSSLRAETDSNYGDVFIVWDRLFGTACDPSPARLAAMRFGLGDEHDPGAGDLLVQLRTPLARRPR